MKRILLALILFNFITAGAFAQVRHPHMMKRQKELRELEQLKLIQSLDLDEETAVRFVARRNKHLEKIREMQLEKNDLISEISDKLKAGDKINSKKYLARLKKIEQQILDEKINFYSSLEDILNDEQIAKLIVFQSRFRKELMRMMMRRRKVE